MNIRSISRNTLTFTVGLLVGCWDGASSLGLPCEINEHCGLGEECINGFCGGVPRSDLCGNGFRDPGEACDNGEQNAEDGACRLDCTPAVCGDGFVAPSEECDEAQANADDAACTSACTLAVCGDGLVGPGEECDTDPVGGVPCGPTCVLVGCGNGILEPEFDEECDDGGESATCDSDCTAARCGDEHTNATAGERCDNDDNSDATDDLGVDDSACMANCTIPLFWDDSETGSTVKGWTHQKLSGGDLVEDNWLRTTRRPHVGRSWDSGMPDRASGDTRLMTPAIDLAGLEGETIALRIDHAYAFKDCNNPTQLYEGGVVEVSVDGGPFVILTPEDGYNGTVGAGIDSPEACPNPLNGMEAFTLDSNYAPDVFDLSAYAGGEVTIGFRMGTDCGNCDVQDMMFQDQTMRGWFIDDVVVWVP